MLLSEAALDALLAGTLTIEEALRLGVVALPGEEGRQLQHDLHLALGS